MRNFLLALILLSIQVSSSAIAEPARSGTPEEQKACNRDVQKLCLTNLEQPHRQCTQRDLPLLSVTGAMPKQHAMLEADAKRSRFVPKAASNRGSRAGPAPGNDAVMKRSGWV